MNSKIKIIAAVYFVFTAIIACRCPKPSYFSWTISEFSVDQGFKTESDKMEFEITSQGNEFNEKVDFSSVLYLFEPYKAYAMQKCETERYYLETKFSGISIKSSARFSDEEPAGTELKSHFKFNNSNEAGDFELVMNNEWENETPYPGLQFSGELDAFPTVDSVHTFTYTFYLETGDSLITIAESITFKGM